MLIRCDDPPYTLRLDHLRKLKSEIDQPMTGSVFRIFPECRFTATMVAVPITCFKISGILSRLELLLPSAECKFVEIPHQNFVDVGIMVDGTFYLYPVFLNIVIVHLIVP